LPTVKTRFRRGCISNLAPQPGVRELLSQIDYGPAHENRELAWSSNRYLPYYLVRVVLESGYDGIANGMRRTDIHDRIRQIHHRGDDVRASDMSNRLGGLANLQSVKSISPPIIDYDSQNRVLQVVDSTFYFLIKSIDTKETLASIQNPLEAH